MNKQPGAMAQPSRNVGKTTRIRKFIPAKVYTRRNFVPIKYSMGQYEHLQTRVPEDHEQPNFDFFLQKIFDISK